MTEGNERRLAAIVSADVVGYSRLMGEDEDGTLARLRAHRSELIDPMIGQHGGRIVKTMGDGLLLEFAEATAGCVAHLLFRKGWRRAMKACRRNGGSSSASVST